MGAKSIKNRAKLYEFYTMGRVEINNSVRIGFVIIFARTDLFNDSGYGTDVKLILCNGLPNHFKEVCVFFAGCRIIVKVVYEV